MHIGGKNTQELHQIRIWAAPTAGPKISTLLEGILGRYGGLWFRAWVAKSWTQLSDFTFTFHFHALEKEMATHYSVLAWRISGMAEPGGLLSMGSHRVGHDWSNLAVAEELKNKHTESNNAITEIKNALEGISSRISEAEERISELEDKMVEITSEEQNKV